MANKIKVKRGLKSSLTSLASGNNIEAGELYSVTDEQRLYLGINANTAQGFIKQGELFGTSAAGLVPATGGSNTTDFLRKDGSWATPPTSGGSSAYVSVASHGITGTPTTGDGAKLQAAIDSLGAAGGTVIIPNGYIILVDSAVTIKPNVSLVGPHKHIGSPLNNTAANYAAIGGALRISSTVTITLKGSANVSGLLVYRDGMTFPANDASAFAGTAFTADGDDVALSRCLIMGFALAFSSNNCQRPHLENVLFDCLGGILISNCADIAYVTQCHGWPFATIASTANATGQLKRSGIAFQMTGTGDWNKITNCFCYGYFRGFNIDGCENVSLIGCGADNTPPETNAHSGAIGFLISGGAQDTKLIGCQTAAHEHGYYTANTVGNRTHMINCDAWSSISNGVAITSGDVFIEGGIIRGSPNGILVTVATSNVRINGVRFNAISAQPIVANVATTNVIIGDDNHYGNYTGVVGGSMSIPTIGSAAMLTIPNSGNRFYITGTTGLSQISNGWAGRVITLSFAGALTVFHGTGSSGSIFLREGGNYVTTAGMSLTLMHNGDQWREVSRSGNGLLFNSSSQGEVTASGGGTTKFLRADNTWQVPPAGSADPLLLPTEVTADTPSSGTPATGTTIFSANRANRRLPAFIDPNGRTERLQTFLGANDTIHIDVTGAGPTASATVGYNALGGNMAADVGGTFGLPALTTTNYLTMQNRKTIAVAATVNLIIESKASHFWCSRRSVGGGFHFTQRFGLETVIPGTGRLFAGLAGQTAALTNVDPLGGFAQSIGLFKNSADTTLRLMLSAAAGTNQAVVLTNTGAVGWNTAGTMFQVEIFCKTGDTGFGWRVTRWTPSTGATVSDQGYVSAGNMPAIDTLFCPHLFAVNVAATATTLAFVSMYCETD